MEVIRAKQEGAIGADYIASTSNVLLICSYDFKVSLKDKLARLIRERSIPSTGKPNGKQLCRECRKVLDLRSFKKRLATMLEIVSSLVAGLYSNERS